jgi:cystathionine beta-lyase
LEAVHIADGNIFGIAALEAAYRHGGEWLDALQNYLEENSNFLAQFIKNNLPGIRIIKPEGTYLAWLDCRGLGLNQPDLRNFFVRKARVGLNDGLAFGKQGEGFMRLNFGCPRETLQNGLERIEKAVKNRE